MKIAAIISRVIFWAAIGYVCRIAYGEYPLNFFICVFVLMVLGVLAFTLTAMAEADTE